MRAFFGIGVRMRISEKAVRPQTKGRREYAGERKANECRVGVTKRANFPSNFPIKFHI